MNFFLGYLLLQNLTSQIVVIVASGLLEVDAVIFSGSYNVGDSVYFTCLSRP